MQIQTQDTQATPDVRAYLGILWRRRWWIVASVLVVGALSLANSIRHDDRFRASAAILLSAPPQVGIQVGDQPLSDSAERQVSNEIERLNSNDLSREVAEIVGRPTDVDAVNDGQNDVIELVTTGNDAEQAAADVNDVLDAYAAIRHEETTADLADARQEVIRQREERQRHLHDLRQGVRGIEARLATEDDLAALERLQAELEVEQRRISTVEQEQVAAIEQLGYTLDQLSDAQEASSGGVQIIGRASVPGEPYFPQPKKDLLVGLCIGLLLGLGLAFIREFADDRILTEDALEHALPDVPLVATLPELEPEATVPGGADGAALGIEAFRSLAASVEFARLGKPVTVIHVTSAVAGEGKSTTAANLAVAFAETGTHVALVDADLRRPTLHTLFHVEQGPGLAGVLDRTADLADALQPSDHLDNLKLLPPGRLPANPTRLLYARRTEELVAELRAQFDVVVIDSPPLLPVADSLVLTQFADLVMLVVRSGHTGRRVLRRARRALERVEVGEVVSVLNRVQRGGPDGYDYYYGRYYADDEVTS